MRQRLILLTPLVEPAVTRLSAIYGDAAEIIIVHDQAGLDSAVIDADTSLISFGSSVIVPKQILETLRKPAYNIHAASPEYPGRDPHHYAVYDGVCSYGATLHIMIPQVDAGPIIAVERFDVPAAASPADLLKLANEAGIRILERFGTRLLRSDPPPAMTGVSWGGHKTRRADFHEACHLGPLIAADEFERRFKAFDGGAYDNLTTELNGWTFRIDKKAQKSSADHERWRDFTEAAFVSLLQALKEQNYEFVRFGEYSKQNHVLLRHDIDFSMQRAARIATIESEHGARATYFVNPRSEFYSIAEPQSVKLAAAIIARGHEVGLHFDAAAYEVNEWSTQQLEEALNRERTLLETIIRHRVKAVSWHNPGTTNLLTFGQDEIADLINVYSARLRSDYTYASDSNGYWRFRPMRDVIAENHPRLHLLTHPGWWTPTPMSPSDRVDRSLLGRARRARQRYDALLVKHKRKNITADRFTR